MARFPRNRRSPYEVMRNRGVTTDPRPVTSGADPSSSTEPQQSDGQSWRQQAKYPVVLRIPRGYALLMGFAAIGLLILAYQTGYTRGAKQIPDPAGDTYPPLANPVPQPVRSTPPPPANPIPAPVPRPELAQELGPVSTDPRKLGMNYFILAHYPRSEAEKLVRFLWEEGVAAAAYRPENKQFFQVVALRGFSREQVRGAAPNAFRQQLHRLGQMWVGKYKGAEDFSQSGIYLAKYKGGKYAEVITRKTH